MPWYRKILPKLLAEITRQPRYLPEFKWSKSWVYNVFRVYEYVFWRRFGIRVEQLSTLEGVCYSYTVENYLATWEGVVRAIFAHKWAFRLVRIPQAQLVGLRQGGLQPYRYAIAFDAVTDIPSTAPAGSTSGNHTVTGSNPILFGMGGIPISDSVTAITYNSAALTLIDKTSVPGDRWMYSFVRMAPSTGTNSFAITATLSDATDMGAISYSGAAQTGQPDAHNFGQGASATSASCSITVVASNCWIVGFCSNDIGGGSLTGTNRVILTGGTTRRLNDSNTTVSTGSNTWTATWSGTHNGALVIASFSPAGAAAAASVYPTLLTLQVGP